MPTTHKGRVVVVEDDDMLADFLAKRITTEGFECVRYANGMDALAGIVAEPAIDLILLDISLPDIDGFEVLNRLKKDVHAAEIPVIVTSNFSTEKDIGWGEKMGIERFLNKASMTPSEIVDAVTETVNKKHRSQ